MSGCRVLTLIRRSCNGGLAVSATMFGLDDYRAKATAGAKRAAAELEARGLEVIVTGSLARGYFGIDSHVDFVVIGCPRHLKYAIEGIVEDALGGIPFDLI